MASAFTKYIIKRTVYIVFSLFGLSILVFVLARVLPGNPARMIAGPHAPPEVVERIRHQLHLDKPLPVQYMIWLKNVFHGDLGYSIYTKHSVTLDVINYLPNSLELVITAVIIQIIGAVVLGATAGWWAYKWPDNLVRAFAYIGISVPSFVWAIIFQLVFGWWLGWFPVQGMFSEGVKPPPRITGFHLIDSLITGNFTAFKDELWHIFMPALALALGPMAQDARIIRAGMVDNAGKDFISLMKSHGLPDRILMFKYLFKPSIIPAVTVMGMDAAALLGNAFLVEIIYNWPGFSAYGIEAMLRKDLNAIVAVVLVIGVIYAIANIIVDIMVAYLDPRVRYLERGE